MSVINFNTPIVSIVIVNWNGQKWLKRCVDSIMNQNFRSSEIIVVDNASTDNSLEFLRSEYPQVIVLPLKENKGFGVANNEGAKIARGEFLFFLNNDAWVKPDTIEKMLGVMKSRSDIGILGCKVLNEDGTIQDIGLNRDLVGFPVGVIGEEEKSWADKELLEVLFVSGCALMISKSLFEELGGFDSGLFLFVEDMDLGWRARLKGKKVETFISAEVFHQGGGTIAGGAENKAKYTTDIQRVYWRERNTLRVLIKNLGFVRLGSVLMLSGLINVLECLFFLVIKPRLSLLLCRAWVWNIAHLRGTLKLRRIIQKNRQVADRDFSGFVYHRIQKFSFLKKGIPQFK